MQNKLLFGIIFWRW